MTAKKIFQAVTLAGTLLFAACAGASRPDAASYAAAAERSRAVADFTDYLREKTNVTGMVACVIFPDGESFFATSGIADVENPAVSLNEETLFPLASLTKMHILLLAKNLSESDTLDLETSVRTFVPELHGDYDVVTLRDLLWHRSGLPREHVTPDMLLRDIPACWLFGDDLARTCTNADGLISTLNTPGCRENLKHPRERYSNIGIGLLGVALERATGKSIPALVRERVCDPLSLTGTTFSPMEFPSERRAGAHAGDVPKLIFRGNKMPTHVLGDGLRASGGIYSTASDVLKIVLRFREIFAESEPVRKLSAADDGRIIYGFEFGIGENGERLLFRHGMFYGSRTLVCFGLDSGVSIFVLCNNCDWPRDDEFELLYFAESLGKNSRE